MSQRLRGADQSSVAEAESKSVPPQLIQLSPFTFGGATRSPIADRHGRHRLLGRWRRATVDQAFGYDGRADSLGDRADDLDDALAALEPNPDLVARADQLGRFDGHTVDTDVSGPARSGRQRPGLGDPDGENPAVYADATQLVRYRRSISVTAVMSAVVTRSSTLCARFGSPGP